MKLLKTKGLELIYWQSSQEKAHQSGLTPGIGVEEVTLIFDTFLSPFHHSPFMYSQLSCLPFFL